MTEQLLLTTRQAAQALAVSERMVRYLIASGELAPVVHIGRSVRIPATTLYALVEKLAANAAEVAPIRSSGMHTARRRVG